LFIATAAKAPALEEGDYHALPRPSGLSLSRAWRLAAGAGAVTPNPASAGRRAASNS